MSSYKDAEEMRQCNFERYRTLVMNATADISEDQCLKQIEIDEKYGSTEVDVSKKPK